MPMSTDLDWNLSCHQGQLGSPVITNDFTVKLEVRRRLAAAAAKAGRDRDGAAGAEAGGGADGPQRGGWHRRRHPPNRHPKSARTVSSRSLPLVPSLTARTGSLVGKSKFPHALPFDILEDLDHQLPGRSWPPTARDSFAESLFLFLRVSSAVSAFAC